MLDYGRFPKTFSIPVDTTIRPCLRTLAQRLPDQPGLTVQPRRPRQERAVVSSWNSVSGKHTLPK